MRRLAWIPVVLLLCAGAAVPARAQTATGQVVAPKPGEKSLCPVCGMIVSKYPAWVATVVWKDGRADHFDGAKDLFKFLQALPEYAPGRTRDAITTIIVTDFYDLKKVDARQAFYVIGSDVTGPMGHEFVPLATRADAEEFLKDHHGTKMLRFDEVTPAIVAKVDSGKG